MDKCALVIQLGGFEINAKVKDVEAEILILNRFYRYRIKCINIESIFSWIY